MNGMKQTKYKLKNGLKVLLIESRKSPVVSVQMWVKNGSADEKKKEEGISHFIEHLVFKGTEKFKTGEIASVVEGSGGELNAYTSFDQTVFYVTISKNYSDTALDVISQMMGKPTFDPKEIDNEREVVIEEIKRGQDSPSRQSSELLFSTVYKKHPYGVPVIGYEKNIRDLSPKKIRSFYEGRYNPGNMFLVIAGDFETAEMKKKVAEYYSDFKTHRLIKVKRNKEPKQTQYRLKVQKSDFEECMMYLSWAGVAVDHKDVAALDVLALILGQGDSSRLTNKLRIESATANSVGAFNYTPADSGLFAISLGFKQEMLQDCLKGIMGEIEEIFKTAPSAEELQKAVTNISSEQVYAVETVDGIARKAGSDEFYMADHKAYEKYLKKVLDLKPEDISKVARKYLSAKTLTMTMMIKEGVKEGEAELKKFAKTLTQANRSLAKAKVKTVKFKPLKLQVKADKKEISDIKEVQLESGTRVIFVRQSDTPTLSARFVFMGGSRLDYPASPGRAEIFSRMWMAGTKEIDEPTLYSRIDSLAAGISPFSGKNTVGISIEAMSPFQEAILDLTKQVILEPNFRDETLQREKQILLNQIKSRQDNPSYLAGKAFVEKLFSDHPYGLDSLGDAESIQRVLVKDIEIYYNTVVTAKNLTVCVVGDFNQELWMKQIKELSERLSKGRKIENRFQFKAPAQDTRVFQSLKKEQSQVIVGFPGITINDKRRYALQVLQSILSGMGGRLFNELREKNSLAYSVSPIKMEGIDAGYFGAYIGCSPEKVEKSIQMMQAEFDKLMQEKVSQDELDRAKRYIIGRHDIELQRKSSICAAIVFDAVYGNDYKENLDVAGIYEKIRVEDIQILAKELFKQHKVISVVGPSSTPEAAS